MQIKMRVKWREINKSKLPITYIMEYSTVFVLIWAKASILIEDKVRN